VLVDPEASILLSVAFSAVVDGRMRKVPPAARPFGDLLQIGLGPGFVAGENCRAVVETQRGHTLGRVYWQGPTQSDSGQPEGDPRRVLRAPLAGILQARSQIGARVTEGETVAVILDPRSAEGETEIRSPLKGVLRGILRPGLHVEPGMKVGDVDPRDDPRLCLLVSDKSIAVGGGVLEALMAAGRGDLR
jgi:xanthine dehydrogenase accessory factor